VVLATHPIPRDASETSDHIGAAGNAARARDHVMRAHETPTAVNHVCSLCKKVFPRVEYLIRHRRRHRGKPAGRALMIVTLDHARNRRETDPLRWVWHEVRATQPPQSTQENSMSPDACQGKGQACSCSCSCGACTGACSCRSAREPAFRHRRCTTATTERPRHSRSINCAGCPNSCDIKISLFSMALGFAASPTVQPHITSCHGRVSACQSHQMN
jgi:hypothetical protein